jgi:hypothetical protein
MTCLCRHGLEAEIYLEPIHNQVLERAGWSAPRFGPFSPDKDTVRIVQEPRSRCGWHKKSHHSRIRSLDLPPTQSVAIPTALSRPLIL